jgi:hypothetical protein
MYDLRHSAASLLIAAALHAPAANLARTQHGPALVRCEALQVHEPNQRGASGGSRTPDDGVAAHRAAVRMDHLGRWPEGTDRPCRPGGGDDSEEGGEHGDGGAAHDRLLPDSASQPRKHPQSEGAR